MNNEKLQELKRLAEAASPGPWRGDRYDGAVKYSLLDANDHAVIIGNNRGEDEFCGIVNGEDELYLLAMHPGAALELIALAERATTASAAPTTVQMPETWDYNVLHERMEPRAGGGFIHISDARTYGAACAEEARREGYKRGYLDAAALVPSTPFVIDRAPVAEAAAQADDVAYWGTGLTVSGKHVPFAAPTAQPTPPDDELLGKLQDTLVTASRPYAKYDEQTLVKGIREAIAYLTATPKAQPKTTGGERQLAVALNDPIEVAERCDSWESFPESALEAARAALRQPGALTDEAEDAGPVPGWLIEYDTEHREVRIKQDGMRGIVPNPMTENLAERTLYALGRALAAKQAGKEA